jgi:hypothetical protein
MENDNPGHSLKRTLIDSVFCSDSESTIFILKWPSFSIHKVRYKVPLCILGWYGLGNRPEGNFSATPCLSSFVALDVWHGCCKNGIGSKSNSEERIYTRFWNNLYTTPGSQYSNFFFYLKALRQFYSELNSLSNGI